MLNNSFFREWQHPHHIEPFGKDKDYQQKAAWSVSVKSLIADVTEMELYFERS